MTEFIEESSGLESTTIGIYRTAATVKGGRRFSFGAMVVVGDRNGTVGIGYGKAPGVPAAVEKAQKNARKQMKKLTLYRRTLPHHVTGRFGASSIRLIPASPGTGVVAGGTARAVLELAGVHDCLTKAHGSTNEKNLAYAVLDGLTGLNSKEAVEKNRGVSLGKTRVEEMLEAGDAYYTPVATDVKRGPEALKPEKKTGRGGKKKSAGKKEKAEASQTPEAKAPEAASGDDSSK